MSKPLQAWRSKGIDIAAWRTANGGISFTFRKSYKDKQSGTYKETKYFYENDLKELYGLIATVLDWSDASGGQSSHSQPQTTEDRLHRKIMADPVDSDEIPF